MLHHHYIIGLAATAIVLSNAQLFSDVTFLVLAAFFAPSLAYAMSKGGGVALYQVINSSVDKTISFCTKVISKALSSSKNEVLLLSQRAFPEIKSGSANILSTLMSKGRQCSQNRGERWWGAKLGAWQSRLLG